MENVNKSKRYRKTKDFGQWREVENFILCPMYGKTSARGAREKSTSKSCQKINDKHAVERVEDKIKANFTVQDWFITLGYAAQPPNEEQAVKDIGNFIRRLKTLYSKNNVELKYLKTIEQGSRSHKWHAHMIIPKGIPIEDIERCWGHGDIFPRRLWSDGNNSRDGDRLNVHNLAEYFVGTKKHGKASGERPKDKKRYSFSRNCREPKITYERMSPNWRKIPKDTAKWQLLPQSLTEYTDAYGFKHQKYTQVRRC